MVVPSLPVSLTTFTGAPIHRPQWHDGLALASPELTGTVGARAAMVLAAANGGGGGGAFLGGFWEGDLLVGRQWCNIALELDPLVWLLRPNKTHCECM